MNIDQEEWSFETASKPLLYTLLFILTSLIHLSFPGYFSHILSLATVIFFAGCAFFNSTELFPDSYAEEIFLRFVIIYLAYFSFLILRQNSSSKIKPSLHNALQIPPSSPWLRGYKLLFNSRGIGTDWELPYLWRDRQPSSPPQKPKAMKSRQIDERASTTASRWTGIAHRFIYLLLNYLFLCIYYNYLDLAGHIRLRPSDTLASKESILRRAILLFLGVGNTSPITQRDLLVRIWSVSDLIIPDYLILSAYHDFFAILFIASGLDEPWEWPPLFGPITEAYSMRRYWSIFWHRLIYKSFNVHAAAVLGVFGVKRNTTAARPVQNFLVFLFSAGMHGIVSWRLGNQCGFGKNLVFWLLQPLAFVLEGVVAAYWKRLRVNLLSYVHHVPMAVFERVIGYMWVVAWLLWCVPKGRYPMLFCGQK